MSRGKWRKSLLAQYLVVVVIFIGLVPLLNSAIIWGYRQFLDIEHGITPKYEYREVEETWHEAAKKMAGDSDAVREEKLKRLKEKYPEATVFWVDGEGVTRLKLPRDADVPDEWTAPMAVAFMKSSVLADPFTVVALLGEDEQDGFMTIQIPRSLFSAPAEQNMYSMLTPFVAFFVIVGLNVGLFVFLSWLFFSRIRRRLTTLQQAMREAEVTGDFVTVPVRKDDEIADLERSFNRMAEQLKESREREQAEEQLRRELIANLSHDLRTPLTVIRGHAYSLAQEDLSEKGTRSLAVIDDKIRYLGELIDNLLSFSLLTAGKYPYRPERLDVVRLLRAITASWYPLLERESFDVEVKLPELEIFWEVDKQWFQRIWDNLFQNALRYAKEGKYVGVSVQVGNERTCLTLEDRGPGLENTRTASKGAGIGLSIVSLMAETMDLKWHIESSEQGTRCFLCKDSPYSRS